MSTNTIAVRPPEILRGGMRRGRAGVYRRLSALIALIAVAASTALLFTDATAEAQDPAPNPYGPVLVSNTGRPSTGASAFCNLNSDCAQGFTTGPNPAGYGLTRIGIDMSYAGSAPGVKFRVSLRSVSDSNLDSENGRPDDVLAYFLRDGSAVSGVNTFEYYGVGGFQLEPNTEYLVVMDVQSPTGSSNLRWKTTFTTEDAGASPGWSIDDSHWKRGQATHDIRDWTTTARSLKMTLTGYVLPDVYDDTPIEDDDGPRVAPGTYTAAQLAPLCRDGFHYVYESVNVYRADRGRLQYIPSNQVPPEGAIRVGLEWRDMCFSDRGNSAYQLHHLDMECAEGGLPVSACDALPAARYAAMGRHPEVIAQRRAAAQAAAQAAANRRPSGPYDPQNLCKSGPGTYHTGPSGASCSGKASAVGTVLYDAEPGADGNPRFQDANGRLYECVEVDDEGNVTESRPDYQVTHYDRCSPA